MIEVSLCRPSSSLSFIQRQQRGGDFPRNFGMRKGSRGKKNTFKLSTTAGVGAEVIVYVEQLRRHNSRSDMFVDAVDWFTQLS